MALAPVSTSTSTSAMIDSTACVGDIDAPWDAASVQGRFGWATIGFVFVPFVYRFGHEKFVAVRIVEQVSYL